MHRLEISVNQSNRRSEISIGKGIRLNLGQLISKSTELNPRTIAIVSNKRVFSLYGDALMRSLKRQKYRALKWLMPDGERHKSFQILEDVVAFLAGNSLERNDIVLALGGGVVGDLAGFSAAIYLRGVPVVQVPTTLLAQIDSSVGGKTGINLPVGKNLVGAFHQPSIVVIDTETLISLPEREVVSGFCEMVKQSLVASQALFEKTVHLLRCKDSDRDFMMTSSFESLIAAHCEFKASIVANDERESTTRSDVKSRRILNFGHTTAHALEAVTNYRVFRHGEAVGYGILVAGELSKNLGLLEGPELESLRDAVSLCGRLPRADNLDIKQIELGLQHDKKSLRGEIKWVLLEGVGFPRIVDGKLITARLLRESLRAGLRHSSKKES